MCLSSRGRLRRWPDSGTTAGRAAGRTLITMDRDYMDDRRFPPAEGGGVLVINAPDEHQLAALLDRVDQKLFRSDDEKNTLPLAGRKLQIHSDWGRNDT